MMPTTEAFAFLCFWVKLLANGKNFKGLLMVPNVYQLYVCPYLIEMSRYVPIIYGVTSH